MVAVVTVDRARARLGSIRSLLRVVAHVFDHLLVHFDAGWDAIRLCVDESESGA